MIEHHVLWSMYIGGTYHAHAYLGAREKTSDNFREMEMNASDKFAQQIKEHVQGFYLPMVMITPLDGHPELIQQVQDVIKIDGPKTEAFKTLANFTKGRMNYVFTAWFMLATNEESQRLFDIH